MNIAYMFGVYGEDPDDDDDNDDGNDDDDVDVAVNENQKIRRIVRRKSTYIGGIRQRYIVRFVCTIGPR